MNTVPVKMHAIPSSNNAYPGRAALAELSQKEHEKGFSAISLLCFYQMKPKTLNPCTIYTMMHFVKIGSGSGISNELGNKVK